MFCNFCGKKIAPEDRVCPYCGQAQESRSGGNGFWDILTNPSAADDADPEPVRTVQEPVRPMREPAPPMPAPPVPSDRRRRKTGRGILILSIITVVLLLASIALNVLLLFNIKAKSSDIDEKIGALNTQLTQMNETLGDMNQSIESIGQWFSPTAVPTESTDASETAPSMEETQPAETEADPTQPSETGVNTQAETPHITKQPVSIENGTEKKAFEISYTGNGCTAVWLYQDTAKQGKWVEIDPSRDEFKSRFIVTPSNGYSGLTIIGTDASVYTKYKCEIRQNGIIVKTSDEVDFPEPKAGQ